MASAPRIEDMYAIDSAVDPITLADGRSAIYCRMQLDATRRTTKQTLWHVDDSGPPRAMEAVEHDAYSPQLTPDGKWILFLSTRPFDDGTPAIDPVPSYSDSAMDIWLIPVSGGKAIPLFGPTKPYGRVISDRFYGRIAFSPDGRRLVFVADDRVEKRSDAELRNNVIVVRDDQGEGYEGYGPMQIWVADLVDTPLNSSGAVAATKITRVTHDDYWYGDPQWAADGSFLIVHANRTKDQEAVRSSINRNYDLWRIHLSDHRLEKLTTGSGPEFSPRISPDGRRLVCLSSPRNGPHSDVYNLVVVDLQSKQAGPAPTRLVFDYHNAPKDQPLDSLPSLPPTQPLPNDCWRDNRRVMYAALRGLKSETQCIDLDAGPKAIEDVPPEVAKRSPLLPSGNSLLGPRLKAVDEVVRWKSFDGMEIDGILTVPHASIAQPPYKLLLVPHGGPHHRASSGGGFDIQLFAANGFAVFQPNFRGSTGYGLKFLDANRFDMGGGDMQDILTGIEHLAGRGIIDRQRQFVYGVSYGGFMASWLVGHTNQFRAAVAQNAVTDLNTMWHLSDIQSWTEWDMGGYPWEVVDRMRKYSPLTYADRVQTPTLILHSLNDRRCPVAMGRMFHRALKERSVETEMVIYPDEGHAIRQLPHREDVLRRTLDWFAKHDAQAITGFAADEDLTVLQTSPTGVLPGKQLELWLKKEMVSMVERRSEAFEKMLKSDTACRAWQAERKAFFLKQIGGLPDRTPLNAQVVGRLDGKGYIVEKILFESRPGHHVTANLYLPNSGGPWPGVIVPCGHSHDGKAAGGYQRVCILMALHGMAAMCYDPIGQGERYQMLDLNGTHESFDGAKHVKTPHPNVHILCTTEHTMMGLGSILNGSNVAQYRIWDGMRAIDYLQSRSDILADKIGCTGNSGGGTLTAYLMALDDRIEAAAPVCYLTTFRRLIESNGAQDAEQNIFGQLAFGMDEADYCIMRAPKPTLICAGTRDSTFDFRGTWEVLLDSKRFYSRLGRSECIEINAPDAPHGYGVQQREAAVRWMHRWLKGSDKIIREVDSLPDSLSDDQLRAYSNGDWTQEQLYCTPRGQVLLQPGERSVFEINAEVASKLRESRGARWKSMSNDEKRKVVRETIGSKHIEADAKAMSSSKVRMVEKLVRPGYSIRKLVLSVEEGLELPALEFVPDRPNGRATLYLHGSSISEAAGPNGPIEQLVKQGNIVLSAELRGIGETETGHDKRDYGYGRFGRDNQEIFLAYLLGKSFVGMRVNDAQRWFDYLRSSRSEGDTHTAIQIVAVGEAAIPALHFAALAPDAFDQVSLNQMIPSWEEVVRAPETFNQAVNLVHGALNHYDLPDLVELVGHEKVAVTHSKGVLDK